MQKKFGVITIIIGILAIIFAIVCFENSGKGSYFYDYYLYEESNLMRIAQNTESINETIGTGLGFILFIAGVLIILNGVKQVVSVNVNFDVKKCCLNCGKEILGNEKFCTGCGSAIEISGDSSCNESGDLQISKVKYCSTCGKQINEDAVICVHCGCSVGKTVKSSATRNTNNDNLFRFLLTFFLGWIGSIVINCTALKPVGFKSRTLAYFFLTAITFGIYGLVASLCNLGFDPNKERNIGYKKTNE